jgi:transcriptional regulator
MGDAPKDYVDAMVKAIVGVQIEVTRLVGKSKLSQNKEARDIQGAAGALKSSGESQLADAMLAGVPTK